MQKQLVAISDILKLNKILDSLGYVDLNVYEAYELYKFNNELKELYSFLEKHTTTENFEKVSKNFINFVLPDINYENIAKYSEFKPSNDDVNFLKNILVS